MGENRALALILNAVVNNDLFFLQEVLMEHPHVDVSQAVLGGMSALHVAAEKGYSSCVTILIASGAKIDLRDEHGLSPLMTGVSSDFPLIVHQLLKAGANPNITSNFGFSPVHMACRNRNMGVVQMLLMAGANPCCWNREGESPLSLTIKAGDLSIAQALLLGDIHVEAEIYARSTTETNPLYYCLQQGKYCIAQLLLLNGYKGVNEVKHFLSMDCRQWNNVLQTLSVKAEVDALNFIKSGGCNALSLQQICRNNIRFHLLENINAKIWTLYIPQSLKIFLSYRDIFAPPQLSSDREVNVFFDDNRSELN